MQTPDEQWYFIGADDKQAGPVTLTARAADLQPATVTFSVK